MLRVQLHPHATKLARQVPLFLVALVLGGCQIPFPQTAPAPRLLPPDSSVNVAGATSRANPATNQTMQTVTIHRGTLQDTLSLSGSIVPGRTTQLAFKGSGMVSAVNVAPGQAVSQGDVLAEFTLDDNTLQQARTQATLAELAYESEQSKLEQMQSPASNDSIQQMQVAIQRDQAAIQKLQQQQSSTQDANDRAQKGQDTAQGIADRKERQAELAVQAAQDTVDAAQASLKHAQDAAKTAQDKAGSDQKQAAVDAAAAAKAAANAAQAAGQQADLANARLAQIKLQPATTSASAQIESMQLKLQQDKDSVGDAQSAVEAAKGMHTSASVTTEQIAAQVAAANAAEKSAERQVAADQLDLKHLQSTLEAAKLGDSTDLKAATYGADAAKQAADNAALAAQQAQQKAQAMANQAAPGGPSEASQERIDAAQVAVKDAQAKLQAAQINLEDAQSAQAAVPDSALPPAQFADRDLTAAQAQLNADQAKLATMQKQAGGSEINQEQVRVGLLRDQSTAAQTAAQPVVQLKAPFDATVSEVGIATGQTLDGGTSVDTTNGANRPPVIRLTSTNTTSVLANASESDVAQLNSGDTLHVTFPSLPGQSADGKIVEIGSTPNAPAANGAPTSTTYPVRLELVSPPQGLKLGMSAQLNMAVNQAQDVLIAPRNALRTFGGRTLVDKLDANGQSQSTPVQVGRTIGPNVEITDGLQDGDTIAVYTNLTADVTAAQNQSANPQQP
jgi:macrolide-specific efflux system membrane fusion protein